MEFVSTERGGRRILYEGYAYILDRKRYSISYWRCEKRSECKSRITTDNDNLKYQPTQHSHPPDPARMHVARTLHAIRQLAVNSDEPTSAIVQHCTMDLPPSAADHLPKKDALERMARRKRQPVPTGDGISNDEPLQTTVKEEYYTCSNDDSSDLNIFTTDNNLRILSTQRHWFCEWKSDSDAHEQLSVNIIMNGTPVPLVYVVARNKDRDIYDRLFTYLKIRRNLDPLSITVDFDQDAIKSIQNNFPNSKVKGCLFHFEQCLWRKIQKLGLEHWCIEEPENGLFVKKCQALAFLPHDRVTGAFEELLISLDPETDELLADFLVYFQTTWIGILQGGRRRRPLFPIDLWNMYDQVMCSTGEREHDVFDQQSAHANDPMRLVDQLPKTENTLDQTSADNFLMQEKNQLQMKEIVRDALSFDNIVFLDVVAHNL